MQALIRLATRGAHGRDWYTKAQEALTHWAEDNAWSPRDVIAAVACTSPRTPVQRNMDKALTLLTNGEVGDGVLPVHIILWEKYIASGTLQPTRRYRKVARFFHALLGCPDAIPLDVWMMRACDISIHSPLAQDKAERLIRQVAQRIGYTPAETQAAVWTGIYERTTGRLAPEIAYVREV